MLNHRKGERHSEITARTHGRHWTIGGDALYFLEIDSVNKSPVEPCPVLYGALRPHRRSSGRNTQLRFDRIEIKPKRGDTCRRQRLRRATVIRKGLCEPQYSPREFREMFKTAVAHFAVKQDRRNGCLKFPQINSAVSRRGRRSPLWKRALPFAKNSLVREKSERPRRRPGSRGPQSTNPQIRLRPQIPFEAGTSRCGRRTEMHSVHNRERGSPGRSNMRRAKYSASAKRSSTRRKLVVRRGVG